ncbi:hypothetical protein B9N64_01795 [Campylobacter concisus]|uniref:hypothetical protein n=1 Tax=Campylobacter concisus TaxID=199 RepID=UPI000B3D64EA|nr:hypothetical protein [Campylobacter concisus]OUT15545.1 hypothetical protein B9N64_01795 [Campylobacter concisus]
MNDINITYSCEESLKKIKEYMADAKSVTLYTSSLNSLESNYFDSMAVLIRNELSTFLNPRSWKEFFSKEDRTISIVTDFYIDKESFKDNNLDKSREFKYRGIPVKVVHKKSAVDKFFVNLKEKIDPIKIKTEKIKYGPGREYQARPVENFAEMFEFIISYYNKSKDVLRECLSTLKDDLINDAKPLMSNEELNETKFERSVKECFDELDKNLKNLNEDDGEFIIKQFILSILSLVDLSGTKAVGKKLIGWGTVSWELINFSTEAYKYYDNKAFYGVSLPILRFFTSRFASIINTLNINSNCNVLVFKSDKNSKAGFFIDFTHLNLDYVPFQINSVAKEINCNADEGYSVYGYLDDVSVFEYTKDVCSYDIINKNLGFGSSEDTLFNRLKEEIKSTNANLNFICASNFNSIKLANLIADKSDKNNTSVNDEMNSKDFSNLNKNYIVLSNSPFRSSSGLREEVISKSLDQTIKDDINRSKSSNLVKQKFSDIKTLNPVKDYSKYSIDIDQNNDKSTLLLNLSPFARIEKNYIDNIIEKKEASDRRANQSSIGLSPNKSNNDELYNINFLHVNAYAKQPNDMEKIKENEKAYMDKVTLTFKDIFEKINKNVSERSFDPNYPSVDDMVNMKKYEDEMNIEDAKELTSEIIDRMPKDHYSLTEVLSIAVAYFIITKSYPGDLVKKSVSNDGEYIEIAEKKIKVIHKNATIRLGEKEQALFFYKDSINANVGEYICIEELRDYMEYSKKGNVASVEELLKANNENKHEIIDTSILGLKEQKQIEELLDKQAKEIEDCWKKDDAILKKTLNMQDIPYETIEKDMKKEAPTLIVKTAIEGLFPFAEYFSEDGQSKIYNSIGSFIFDPNKKEATDELLDELGVLNIVRQLFTMNNTENVDKFIKHITNSKTNVEILRKSKGNLLKQAINSVKLRLLIGRYNISIIWNSMRSFAFMKQTYMFNPKDVEAMRNMLKGYGKSLGKDVGVAFLKGMVELYKTSYEKLEENYNEIMHTRYTYKFNEAYALNNISYKPMSIKEAYDKNSTNSYCYYPVMIYQNYISLNLNRLFLGANINSGGLDYNSFIYYDINNKQSKLSHNLASKLALNNLSAYLCLDELRGAGNEVDASYFKYARSRYTNSDVEIRELNLDVKEEKEIYDIYNKGNGQDRMSFSYAIKDYQKAVEIINKFKKGIFNTSDENNHSNLSRDLIKALDTIGNNNIKGVYAGCKDNYKNGELNISKPIIPPRLIGRVATTIVMEDGLYIG